MGKKFWLCKMKKVRSPLYDVMLAVINTVLYT